MISEADLVTALHQGACKATKDYLAWSDGTFLNECAGESYMVACNGTDRDEDLFASPISLP